MSVDIKENFLEPGVFSNLRGLLCLDTFPWYYGPVLNYDDESEVGIKTSTMCKDLFNHQFVHSVYSNYRIRSNIFDILEPVFEEMDIKSLIRIKINLNPRTERVIEHGLHTDYNYDSTTSILYVNTNDGYTKFEDGTKIESKDNRLITFPSSMYHTGTTCTNAPGRIVINFNYF